MRDTINNSPARLDIGSRMPIAVDVRNLHHPVEQASVAQDRLIALLCFRFGSATTLFPRHQFFEIFSRARGDRP